MHTHTHRAGMTDTLEATFNEAHEGGGARGSEMKMEVGVGHISNKVKN